MLYLLDANTLIDANRNYYGISQVPEYWEWLVHWGCLGRIKIPIEIYEELKIGSDELSKWAKNIDVKSALVFEEEVNIGLIRQVILEGYGSDLDDIEVEKLGRDPFLIAYAAVAPKTRVVVTSERSKPNATRGNRKIPDICTQFNIRSCNAFEFGHEMGFRTNWRDHI